MIGMRIEKDEDRGQYGFSCSYNPQRRRDFACKLKNSDLEARRTRRCFLVPSKVCLPTNIPFCIVMIELPLPRPTRKPEISLLLLLPYYLCPVTKCLIVLNSFLKCTGREVYLKGDRESKLLAFCVVRVPNGTLAFGCFSSWDNVGSQLDTGP